jgi:S1-C subfamily serine protease
VELWEGSPLAEQGVRGAQEEAILGNQRVYIGGDILIAVDGQNINTLEGLDTLLETRYKVGDAVIINLLRDRAEQSVTVTLIEEPTS